MLTLALSAAVAQAGGNLYCGGGAPEPFDPNRLPDDLSLAAIIEQPASIGVCLSAYEMAKCGDVQTANQIYDKCFRAGYTGALIRQAHLLEIGAGSNPPDPVAATELIHRVATSGQGGWAALGKLHYASALYLGRGVPQDRAAARHWFELAAQEGDPDAAAFLRTGYHTGELSAQGWGVGQR